MKLSLTVFVAMTLVGCSGDADRPPVVPSPSPSPAHSTAVVALVMDQNGSCIVGATVEVVAGQATGQRLTQTQPCGYWDYGAEVIFPNLTPGVELTLRATASGYTTVQRVVVPSPARVELTLARIND